MQVLYRKISLPAERKLPLPVFLFFALPLIAAIAELSRNSINNYQIFKHVFWHTVHQVNLYVPYPDQYFDTNHYGPLFSLVIAPFALLPDGPGVILWVMANALLLFLALKDLAFNEKDFLSVLLIVAVENMTASHNVQFNPMMAAWIILSYTLVRKEKDFWATFLIVAGTFVKLYSIVGLAFFLFSKHKSKFLGSLALWAVVLFCLPMLISSPSFIIHSYADWFNSLVTKNAQNVGLTAGNMQDISLQGMIRRIFNYPELSNLMVLAPAGMIAALPLLRWKLLGNTAFQLHYLALMLISVVIFSSSAESATYVIALGGVAVWFVLNSHKANKWDYALLAFVLLLTSFSPTDLFPKHFKRTYITPYSLKALPCVIVWFVIAVKLIFNKNQNFNSPALHEA